MKLVFGRTEPEPRNRNHGARWTDRRGSRNSYLDVTFQKHSFFEKSRIIVCREFHESNVSIKGLPFSVMPVTFLELMLCSLALACLVLSMLTFHLRLKVKKRLSEQKITFCTSIV